MGDLQSALGVVRTSPFECLALLPRFGPTLELYNILIAETRRINLLVFKLWNSSTYRVLEQVTGSNETICSSTGMRYQD